MKAYLFLILFLFGTGCFLSCFANAESPDTLLTCASPDQSVRLALDGANDSVQFSLQNRSVKFDDAEKNRVLRFTNGETVVREVATGRTVLSFREVPLSRQDRGFEKKMIVSQADRLSVPTIVQCRFVARSSVGSALVAKLSPKPSAKKDLVAKR